MHWISIRWAAVFMWRLAKVFHWITFTCTMFIHIHRRRSICRMWYGIYRLVIESMPPIPIQLMAWKYQPQNVCYYFQSCIILLRYYKYRWVCIFSLCSCRYVPILYQNSADYVCEDYGRNHKYQSIFGNAAFKIGVSDLWWIWNAWCIFQLRTITIDG